MLTTRPSVIFCGTPAFAVSSLQALINEPGLQVSLVITQPDKPVGRSQTLTAPPVKTAALAARIPVLQPASLNDAVALLPPCDFLVVVAYGQILSQSVLDHPRIASVNVHASLLPLLRGASPIQHAILLGHAETGVTIQLMEASLDSGPILGQQSVTMHSRETAASLHDALATTGAALLVKTLLAPLRPVPQEHAMATYCRKLTKRDGIIDPQTMDALTIDRMVRSLTPWPGARLSDVTILASSLVPTQDSTPLTCAEGSILHIEQVVPAGRRPMTGAAWARGNRSR